jgi:hypothetical protein
VLRGTEDRAEIRRLHRAEAIEQCGQCLAGPGGRGNEYIVARADFRPAEALRLGDRGESCGEPLGYQWIEWMVSTGVENAIRHGGSLRSIAAYG